MSSLRREVLELIISVDRPPVALGYEVFVRSGEQEQGVRKFACPAGWKGRLWGFADHWQGTFPDRIDVIFRPSVEAAVSSVDCMGLWDGEVVFHDVPVQKPITRPKE